MLSDLNGQMGTKLVVATIVVALALIVFFLASRAWRNRGTRAFLRGGRNRQPRLAVLDAAAVDAKRRIVLVRRDNVEHLLLIGGPTDVVIESRIGAGEEQPAHAEQAVVTNQAVDAEEPVVRAEPAKIADDRLRALNEAPRAKPVKPAEPAAKAEAPRRPAEAVKASPAAVAGGTEAAAVADYGEAAPHSQADVANILDGERARVFGPAAAPQDSPYVRAYTDIAPSAIEPQATIGPASASVVHFEDFLEEEIAGDLSGVKPAEDGIEHDAIPVKSDAAPVKSAEPAWTTAEVTSNENSLDEEMARLLGGISDRRQRDA